MPSEARVVVQKIHPEFPRPPEEELDLDAFDEDYMSSGVEDETRFMPVGFCQED